MILATTVVVAGAAAVAPVLLARGDDAPRLGADVQPIFDAKCVSCHPVAYPYLDLRRGRSYDDLVRVAAETRPAFYRVLPGRPDLSYLLTHPPDPSQRDLVTGSERKTIEAWIRAGAKDD